MKKFAFIALILLIAGGAWYAAHKDSSTTGTIDNSSTTASGHPDPSNATFSIDDTNITLKSGIAETDAGAGITQETELTKIIGYGDLNADKSEDAAFFLTVTNAVSGALNIYVAAYVSGPVGYKTTAAVPVGIQVSPESVHVQNGMVTITYLGRRLDDPLAADPTVLTTKSYIYDPTLNSLEEK